MAYQVPERWSQGDKPTAAKMNKYSDGQNADHTTLNGEMTAYPVEADTGSITYLLTHVHRWLVYDDNGTIEDPANSSNVVTLSDPGSNPEYYDLDTISWMTYGKDYFVKDIDWIMEVRDPV